MDTAQALSTLGVPGLVVIILSLAGTIIYLYRRLDSVQSARLGDAKEIRDKLGDSMEQQTILLNRIYDAVASSKRST